jgi:hypothetical protein
MRRRFGRVSLAFMAISLLWSLSLSADTVRSVDHARLILKDILPSAPQGVADLEFGPAPPPGGKRTLTRAEIEEHLRARGVDVRGLGIPERVRITTAGRRITMAELVDLARPVVDKALAPGVTVTSLRPSFEVFVPARAELGAARLPKPPRQKGLFRTTATLEFVCDGEIVARVPVAVTLDVSEAAATPDARRGSRIDLVVSHGAVRITTVGTLLSDADIGETVNVTVVATNRVVKARLVQRTAAEVLDIP